MMYVFNYVPLLFIIAVHYYICLPLSGVARPVHMSIDLGCVQTFPVSFCELGGACGQFSYIVSHCTSST